MSGIAWHQEATSRWLYAVEVNAFDRGTRAFVPAILDAPVATFRSVPSSRTTTEFRRLRANLSKTLRI